MFAKNTGKYAFIECKKARKINPDGFFSLSIGSKCSISKQVNTVTNIINTTMAYETRSKLLSMRIRLTKDRV